MSFLPLDGSILQTDMIKLSAYETHRNLLGGIIRLTDWSGQVFLDEGGHYHPLAGVKISLLSYDGVTLHTVITEGDGRYFFGALLPEDYYISVWLPGSYLLVHPDDNAVRPPTIIHAEYSGSGISDVQTLIMGEDRHDLDIIAVQSGGLGDKAWLDENANGLQDTGERPVSGVVVEILRNSVVIAEAVSNDTGYYMINNIYPGIYDVRVTFPEGLRPTAKRTDIPILASVLDAGGGNTVVISNVEILSGVIDRNFDLGFLLTDKDKLPHAVKEIPIQKWK
jgi:hypothetical protein